MYLMFLNLKLQCLANLVYGSHDVYLLNVHHMSITLPNSNSQAL